VNVLNGLDVIPLRQEYYSSHTSFTTEHGLVDDDVRAMAADDNEGSITVRVSVQAGVPARPSPTPES